MDDVRWAITHVSEAVPSGAQTGKATPALVKAVAQAFARVTGYEYSDSIDRVALALLRDVEEMLVRKQQLAAVPVEVEPDPNAHLRLLVEAEKTALNQPNSIDRARILLELAREHRASNSAATTEPTP